MFDLREAILEVIQIQKQKADLLEINVEVEYHEFHNEEDFYLCTDEFRVQQVVLNFLSNALKFTSRKGKVTIKCTFLKNEG